RVLRQSQRAIENNPNTTTTVTSTVSPRCGGWPPAMRVTNVARTETSSTSIASAMNAARRKPLPPGGPKPPRPTQGGGPSPHGRRRSSGIREPVPHAMDRQDVARPAGLRLDLASEVLHVRVDRAVVRIDRDAVQRILELPAGEDPAGLADHRAQELELR